jgi:hypothetical protein
MPENSGMAFSGKLLSTGANRQVNPPLVDTLILHIKSQTPIFQ